MIAQVALKDSTKTMEESVARTSDGLEASAFHMSRRNFLLKTTILTPLGVGLALAADVTQSPSFAAPPCQYDWARCQNCNTLFFNGYRNKKGCCAAFGVPTTQAHVAERLGDKAKPYSVAYDDSTGPGQGDWRYCGKCGVLFFNGYPDRGMCAGDGKPHEAAGWNFFLYHDRQAHMNEEANWHFCRKCNSLFHMSASNAAGCPRDGKGHEAAGYKFVVGQKQGCIDDPCPRPECST
jgi:hypothetical protein